MPDKEVGTGIGKNAGGVMFLTLVRSARIPVERFL
jgi:hypothetical protein